MATALQKQLATIAAASTNELDLKAQRSAHAQSLLFDPEIAISQSFDTLYQICIEGFEDLCSLDQRFLKYHRSLFSPQSKSEDRSQMNNNETAQLDIVIESFLGLVGSRLLLKPAVKAVEWLVRRFRVHEYNTERLILTFLPYHTGHLFTTMLSILPKKLPDQYRFLYTYINTLTNPPRSIIVYTAQQSPAFLNALNRHVLKSTAERHHYSALITLWTSVVIQALDLKLQSTQTGRQNVQQQREEEVMIQILPVIEEAFSRKKAPELIIGAYMVVVVLATRADMQSELVAGLQTAVASSWTSETLDAGLGCLAVLCERHDSTQLPHSVFAALMRVDRLVLRLQALAANQSVRQLIICIITALMRLKVPFENSAQFVAECTKYQLIEPVEAVKIVQVNADTTDVNVTRLLLEYQGSEDAEAMDLDEDSVAPGTASQSLSIIPISDTHGDTIDEATFEEAMKVLGSIEPPSSVFVGRHVRYCKVFQSALAVSNASESHSQRLVDLVASQDSSDGALVTSILLHSAFTDDHPKSRATALKALLQFISQPSFAGRDLQELVPFVLVLAGQSSKAVRQSAVDIIGFLGDRIQAQNQQSKKTAKYFSLYGDSTPMESALTSKALSILFEDFILGSFDQCIADASHNLNLIKSVLDDESFKKSPNVNNIKSGQRTSIMSCMCEHATKVRVWTVRSQILRLLVAVDKCHGHPRTKWLMPILEQAQSEGVLSSSSTLPTTLEVLAKVAHPSDQESVLYILSSLRKPTVNETWITAVANQVVSCWESMKVHRKTVVLQEILNLSTEAAVHKNVKSGVKGILSGLKIPSESFVYALDNAVSSVESVEKAPAKRRRISGGTALSSESSAVDKSTIAKISLIMELIEGADVPPSEALVYSLMNCLKTLADWKSSTQLDFGYLEAQSLSSALLQLQKLESQPSAFNIEVPKIRVDTIVDNVCTTTNIQARNSGLLILALLAKHIPDVVLQTVMPVFTLMADSTARESDNLSAYVVDQVIQEIIPRLATSMQGQKISLTTATEEIISHFASAFSHIPSSRRLRLFTMLASALGVVESTFAIIAALVEQSGSNSEAGSFATQVLKQFGSEEYLETLSRYLLLSLKHVQHLSTLTSPNQVEEKKTSERDAMNLLKIVPDLLDDKDIQGKLRTDLKQSTTAERLRGLFSQAFETALKLTRMANEANIDSASLCARILEGLLKLLPLDEFAQVATTLLATSEEDLLRSVVRITELQVRSARTAERSSQAKILTLIPRIVSVLQNSSQTRLKYTSIACLDRIVERFGRADAAMTLLVAETASTGISQAENDSKFCQLSLHCLASSISILGDEFIPLLQSSSKSAIACLQRGNSQDSALHDAALAYFISLMETLPMMVPYPILVSLFKALHISAAIDTSEDSKQSRLDVVNLIATRLDIKIVCDLVKEIWHSALDAGSQATNEHVKVIQIMGQMQSKSSVSSNIEHCWAALASLLDFRQLRQERKLAQLISPEESSLIEQQIIEAFIAFILKSNDAAFRPRFIQLVKNASDAKGQDSASTLSLRRLTLFNFLHALSERLKSLVTSYFQYVVDLARDVLTSSSGYNETSHMCILSTLKALTSSFVHDQDDFWQSPARHNTILSALMNLFTSASLPRFQSDVIAALVELGNTASSPENLKDMNGMILKLFRHDNPRIRLAAVKTQQALTEKLNEDWLGLLPEMLPSISELQEDDDERVERETTRWIKMIEGILGESLDTMLQ